LNEETAERFQPQRVLVLEPYYGGSHRAFVDTLQQHSRHTYEICSLPARKWKWRMRGAAIWFAQQLAGRSPDVDLILTSDMLSVTDLRALLPAGWQGVPIACYFHENQLTYPLSEDDWRDYQFGFTNITSCLAADALWFNSQAHLDAFLAAAGELLACMPDHVPTALPEQIAERAVVLWPPVAGPPASLPPPERTSNPPIRILWSHRWEYDKNPELFFRTLFRLMDDGQDFRLILLGESFREAPAVFGEAWQRLQTRVLHAGFVPDRDAYWERLQSADIVASTAIQENFGISVVEAMLAGCWPVLPHRLSYPEILPNEFHTDCLYEDDNAFLPALANLLQNGLDSLRLTRLQPAIREHHDVVSRTAALDAAIDRVSVAGRKSLAGDNG
jgi:glycosyltransferase involved in cell wall biosynthesis